MELDLKIVTLHMIHFGIDSYLSALNLGPRFKREKS